MAYTIKTADLANMTERERAVVLTELTESANGPRNGQAVVIDARIRKFESRYEMSSEELLRRLHSGEIAETAEVSQWLFWLNTRSTPAVNG